MTYCTQNTSAIIQQAELRVSVKRAKTETEAPLDSLLLRVGAAAMSSTISCAFSDPSPNQLFLTW